MAKPVTAMAKPSRLMAKPDSDGVAEQTDSEARNSKRITQRFILKESAGGKAAAVRG